ncbi:19308_t:CDS:1, partial [Cetraspora pellucida]
MPYITPKVLQDKNFTKAANIYEFKLIMMEMSTGQRVFDDKLFTIGSVTSIGQDKVK